MENGFAGAGRRGFLRACGLGLGAAVLAPLVDGGAARAATGTEPDPDRLFRQGKFAAADLGYAQLLARDPGDARAWAQRGYLALLSNRFGDTERFLGTAITLAPADTASMSRLADCYVRRGDFARAVPLLRAAGDQIGAAQYGAVSGPPYQVSGAGGTRVPFQTLDPLPSADATVNGVRAAFTLDTGATFTFSAAMAEAAGVKPAATVQVNNGNGPVPGYVGVVDSLRIGAIEIRNVPVLWDDVSFTSAPGDGQPAGVIGTTIFSRFQTTMDYAGRALILRRPGAVAARSAGAATAPIWLAPDHFIFSQGSIGAAGPGLVLVDTGGVGLGVVLTAAQAAAADVVPDYGKPESDLGATVYPCTADVAIGRVTRRDLPGVSGPVAAPAPFGFGYLGAVSHEFFKPLSVTFDFTAMTAFITEAALSPRSLSPTTAE